MKYKVAIIGASTGQLPICQKANELGYETHCFAYDRGAVCKEFVYEFHPISILDKDAIVEKCKNIKIDAVVSNASDLTAEVASYVAEQLGLVCTPYSILMSLHDKHFVRSITNEIGGLATPEFYLYEGVDYGLYPCVVKPCEGAGKKGVSFVHNKEEFQKAIQYALNDYDGNIIVEEYISGKEISVESISYKGQHYIVQITDKDSSSAPHFVELGHHQPARISEVLRNKINQVIPEILNAMKYTNGASHIELKYSDSSLFLIEANLRGGGDYISNVLVQYSTGVDYLKCMIDVALGIFEFPGQTNAMSYSGVYFLCKQTEYLLPFFEYAKDKDWLVESSIYSKELELSHTNYERNGYLIYKANCKIEPNMSDVVVLDNKHSDTYRIISKFLTEVNKELIYPISATWLNKILAHAIIITDMSIDKSSVNGWLVLYCNDDKTYTAYCAGLHVLKPYRGKGKAKLLLQKAIEICEHNGMSRFALYCKTDNIEARNLYIKYGFKEVSREVKPEYNNEEYWYMVLELN